MQAEDSYTGINLGHCRLVFEAEQAGYLPDWLGSAWRGMLGHALKRAVCTTGLRECAPCHLVNLCPYPAIYEARPSLDPHILRNYPQAPGPFVLRPSPGGQINIDQQLSIELLLFGKHIPDLPLVVRGLILAAQTGIGESRVTLRLCQMMTVDAEGVGTPVDLDQLDRQQPGLCPQASIQAPAEKTQIEFLSPLRLRIRNRYLGPEQLRFRDFFSSLLRRYSALTAFYGDGEPNLDFRGLVQRSETMDFQRIDLAWHNLARRSSRQGKTIPMGGVVGRAELSGPALRQLWPLLWSGQWLHVGKGVNMGLGQYRLDPQR